MEQQSEKIKDNEFIDFEKKKKKKKKKKKISYENEVLRKSIHMISLLMPILYTFLSKDFASLVLFLMATAFVITDLTSKLIPGVGKVYFSIFGTILRKHEKNKSKIYLNGASWVLIGAFITVFIFPKIIAITALTILVISDLSAALIGIKYGKTKFLDKSLEGSLTFFVTGAIIILYLGYFFMMPWTYFVFGMIAVLAASLIEAASNTLNMDDNMSIPITIGIFLWLGGWWTAQYNITYLDLL